ncbi:MAG: hypothetical protein AB1Z67_00475 [Candidatus Limnocylindrales bacterium]
MTVLADFTDEEQELIRHAVAAAATAVSAASLGRKEETVSEGFAAAELILKSQPGYVGNTLVTSILVGLQLDLQAGRAFPDYLERVSAPGAYDEALIVLRRASSLVGERADAEEAEGYRRWLLDIARTVAEAGKEDQGFLGRGGVLVNEAERAALDAVATALDLDTEAR